MVGNGVTGNGNNEVRPLWKMSVQEPDGKVKRPCLMQNAPLKLFICPRIASCNIPCSQKEEQEGNQDYVFRQRLKLHMKVERTMQERGDARRD